MRAARVLIETRGAQGAAAPDPARPAARLRSLVGAVDSTPHDELAQTILEESGLIDMWKAERTADAAGRLENLKELTRSMGEFPEPRRLPRTRLAGDGGRERRRRRARLDHDPARRQGPRVRHRLPAGLGRRSVSPSARARRERARRARGGAAARLCRADARAPRSRRSISPPIGACAVCGRARSPSRFIDELPEDHVEVVEASGAAHGGLRRLALRARALLLVAL